MKKILMSVAMIAAAAAIVVGATTAYFSDTETSTGNTFTAGVLDLVIDVDGVIMGNIDGLLTATDMKPGDSDEKTLSLHVDNSACGFVSFDLASDKDNGCTEPEEGVEPGTCGDENDPGELNDAVQWLIWRDEGSVAGWNCPDYDPECDADPQEGNNVLDPNTYDELLTYGPLIENEEWGFGGIRASDVQYYGFAWCFGIWDEEDGTCDGSLIGNEAQGDSFEATMEIKAEQYRNQYSSDGAFPEGCPIGEDIGEF